MKKVSQYILGIFFTLAGINHFLNSSFYLPLIPDYLPFHPFINVASGIVEILLGIGVLLPKYRKISSIGIACLLILFIPSHVFFIQQGHCLGELCVSPWIGWVRLLLIHPLLILWAYWHTKQ